MKVTRLFISLFILPYLSNASTLADLPQRLKTYKSQMNSAFASSDQQTVNQLVDAANFVLQGASSNDLKLICVQLGRNPNYIEAFIKFIKSMPFDDHSQVIVQTFAELSNQKTGNIIRPILLLANAFPLLLETKVVSWWNKVGKHLGMPSILSMEAILADEQSLTLEDIGSPTVRFYFNDIIQHMKLDSGKLLQQGHWRMALLMFLNTKPTLPAIGGLMKQLLDYPMALSHLYVMKVADLGQVELNPPKTAIGRSMALFLKGIINDIKVPIPPCQDIKGETLILNSKIFMGSNNLTWEEQKELMTGALTWLTFKSADELPPLYEGNLTRKTASAFFNAKINGFCSLYRERPYPGVYIDELDELDQ